MFKKLIIKIAKETKLDKVPLWIATLMLVIAMCSLYILFIQSDNTTQVGGCTASSCSEE